MRCDWTNTFPNSDDVFLVVLVEVDIILVDEMMPFDVVGVVPILLPFLWNHYCHTRYYGHRWRQIGRVHLLCFDQLHLNNALLVATNDINPFAFIPTLSPANSPYYYYWFLREYF